MEIVVLYVAGCPNRRLARAHVDRALAQAGLAAAIQEQEVRTTEEAARLGMRGSPTILVNGHDPFGAADDSTVLACRLTGPPTVEQLVEALVR
jgi:hypothetical protein